MSNPFTDIWNGITGIFRNIGKAEDWALRGISSWAGSVVRGMGATYNQARWLVTTALPHAVSTSVNQVTGWVTSWVSDVVGVIRHDINNIVTWERQTIGTIESGLGDFERWAFGWVKTLGTDVSWLLNRVGSILGSAERLAAWAIGAIWDALVNFVRDHAESLAGSAWKARGSLYDLFTHLMEDFLSSIL